MSALKICRAIVTKTTGEFNIDGEVVVATAIEFAPEHPELIDPHSTNIHPDKDGVMWYWTPEPPDPME